MLCKNQVANLKLFAFPHYGKFCRFSQRTSFKIDVLKENRRPPRVYVEAARWCLNQNSIRFQNNFTAPPSQRSPSLLIFQTRPRAYAPLPIFLCFDSWLFIRFSKRRNVYLGQRDKNILFYLYNFQIWNNEFLKMDKRLLFPDLLPLFAERESVNSSFARFSRNFESFMYLFYFT